MKAMLIKGGSTSSDVKADGWRRILTSRQFGNTSNYQTFVNFIKKRYSQGLQSTQSLGAAIANRLIP